MAAFELLFGVYETSRIHMMGLQQIMNLRGKLQKSGSQEMIGRSLLWLEEKSLDIHGIPCFSA